MHKKLDKSLPTLPGVYLFKDAQGEVLYIGKAKSLKNRVSSYFHKQKTDWKIQSLIEDYDDLEFILTKNETEALLLETQLIQEYQPKYNVLLKSGQPFIYILFTKQEIPQVLLVRNKKQKGKYFGPFLHKSQARRVYRYLMEKFKLSFCNKKIENGCLQYHIGICPGSCKSNFDINEYLFRIELAQDALKKNHNQFLQRIQDKIKQHNENLDFEKAKHLHEYTQNFEIIFETIRTHFTHTKYAMDIATATSPKTYVPEFNNDIAQQLKEFLQLDGLVHTIDCFDISHFQSRSIVGSCIRFTDGKPDKNKFRRFKVRSLTKQNDYAALQEIVARRYRNPENIPDLIVIDGGKGQLNAVKQILPNANIISLAKREETIFSDNYPEGIQLSLKTDIGKLFIALRDYTHHFAISYHRLQRSKNLN